MIGHRPGRGDRRTAGNAGLAAAARDARDALRKRDQVFERDLLADPAWDMLLDMFIAVEEGRRLSVASACMSAPVPTDTALRCIAHLTQVGLVGRRSDPDEPGTVYLAPTERAIGKLTLFFTRPGRGEERSAA
jgi:hypothetical protein